MRFAPLSQPSQLHNLSVAFGRLDLPTFSDEDLDERTPGEGQGVTILCPYPNCSSICRDSIIFTGLMGRKVRDTRTSPARLSRV